MSSPITVNFGTRGGTAATTIPLENEKINLQYLRGKKTVGLIPSLLVPVRTNRLKTFATDMLMPATHYHAQKVDILTHSLFTNYIGKLGAMMLDAVSLPMRVITCVPRMIHNARQESALRREFMAISPIDLTGVDHVNIDVTVTHEDTTTNIAGDINFISVPYYKYYTELSVRRVRREDTPPPYISSLTEVSEPDIDLEAYFNTRRDAVIHIDLDDESSSSLEDESSSSLEDESSSSLDDSTGDSSSSSSSSRGLLLNPSNRVFTVGDDENASIEEMLRIFSLTLQNAPSETAPSSPVSFESQFEKIAKMIKPDIYLLARIDFFAHRSRNILERLNKPKPDVRLDRHFGCPLTGLRITAENGCFVKEEGMTYTMEAAIARILENKGLSPTLNLPCSDPIPLTMFEDRCPLTEEPFLDPYICIEDGITYERAAIDALMDWIERSKTDKPDSYYRMINNLVNSRGHFEMTFYPHKILSLSEEVVRGFDAPKREPFTINLVDPEDFR